MTFALVESAGGFTATVPPLVVAGSPLFFVLSTSQLPASTLDTVRLRYRVEKDDAEIWGTSEPYVREAVGTEPRRRRSGRAAQRIFRIDTLQTWSGFLVLVIQLQQTDAAIVAPVQLVQADELFSVERELDAGLRERHARPDNPAEGDEEFSVPEVLREAGGYASEAADLLGPSIEVVVRPHQQSLAVLGGFERRTSPKLIGNADALRSDVTRIMGLIHRRVTEPCQFRVAFQVLQRRGTRGQRGGPVLFIQFSVPADPGGPVPVTLGLVEELASATNSAAWDFRVTYKRKRIWVVGRVGPLTWPSQPTSQYQMI